MKRKFILIVPIASVTLWANSFGVLVNAQDINEVNGEVKSFISQDAYQNKEEEMKTGQANCFSRATGVNQPQQSLKPCPELGTPDVKDVTGEQEKMTASIKEKRKDALAKDYEQRKAKANATEDIQ